MSIDKPRHLKGILFSLTGFSLFAVGDAAYKYLAPYYSALTLLFYSATLVVLCLLAGSPKLGGLRQTFKSRALLLHLLRGVVLFFQAFLFIWALRTLPMAKAYALIFVAPFMTALFAIPLLKDRVAGGQWIAIAAGFLGVLIILRPGMVPLDLSALAVLGSAALFSLCSIGARYIGRTEQTLLSWGLFPEIAVLLCALIALGGFPELPPLPHLGLLLFIGITSAGGITCLSLAFVHAPPAVAGPFHYVQMLWGIVLGYFLFGDALDLWTGIGALVIIASGFWLIRHKESLPPEMPPAH